MEASTALHGLWPYFAASFAGVVGLELIRYWISQTLRGIRHRWTARRAIRGEAHAEMLLERAGYRIIGRQVERPYPVRIDGHETRVVVRADLLVRDRQGETLVAEVKTGREAPKIENAATRRQLLEYRVAFDTRKVLLVDADTDEVRTVTFPIGETKPDPMLPIRGVMVGVVIGLAGAAGLAATLAGLIKM